MELLKDIYLVDDKGNKKTKDHFAYLKDGCDDIPIVRINDVELYEELLGKFNDELGFSPDEVKTIWKIVAAVMHVGNLELDLTVYDDVTSNIFFLHRYTM